MVDETSNKIATGQTFNAADIIAYQAGAVVSRTIIDEDQGTVTLFAFDEGQGLSEHTAPFDALVLILEGSAETTISGHKTPVKLGEMVIIPAGKPHSIRAIQKCKMLLIMIRA